jgi:hypothetical protein
MLDLNLIAQRGKQKDNENRMALLTTDWKQFTIEGPPELTVGGSYHCSSYTNDIRHGTAERGGNCNRLRRSMTVLKPLQEGECLYVKSTCFGIFQKFWRGITVDYYRVSRTKFFKNCLQCLTKIELVN